MKRPNFSIQVLLVFLAAIALPSTGFAAISRIETSAFGKEGLGLRGLISSSLGSTTVADGQSAPLLLSYDARIQADMALLGPLSFGAEFGVGLVRQMSELSLGVGNKRGTRWWIGLPSIATQIGPVTTQLSFQFLGSYSLSNSTSFGADVALTSPIGAHLSGTVPMSVLWHSAPEKLRAGLVFDWTSFGGAELTPGGDLDPASSSVLWTLGLTVGWMF